MIRNRSKFGTNGFSKSAHCCILFTSRLLFIVNLLSNLFELIIFIFNMFEDSFRMVVDNFSFRKCN